MTVASNQFQNHNQLLRHGMLNWVTRGVYLGYQRNYLELQVDDLFLGDDAWDEATNTTSYDPARASRMTPADVDRAIAWSRARGLRLDMAYNGGGSALGRRPADPLTAKFADPAVRNAFGYVNHTLDHPNLDCSTAPFIRSQITSNLRGRAPVGCRWTAPRSSPASTPAWPTHGRATPARSTRRRSPTPSHPWPRAVRSPRGTLRLRGDRPLAQGRNGRVDRRRASWSAPPARPRTRSSSASTPSAMPWATTSIARSAGTGAWARVATIPATPNAPTDDGVEPITVNCTDTIATPPAAAPPASNGAALDPYGQNPQLLAALNQAGIRYIASDASKGYPSNPTVITSPLVPAGASFTQGAVRAFAALPEQRLLQRLAPGPAARRVQLDLRRAGQRRRLRPDRGRDDLPHDARDLGRVRDERDARHVPPPDGQRPAAALLPPEQPRRLQPGAAGHATPTRAASCTRSSTRSSTATRRPSTGRARRSCS